MFSGCSLDKRLQIKCKVGQKISRNLNCRASKRNYYWTMTLCAKVVATKKNCKENCHHYLCVFKNNTDKIMQKFASSGSVCCKRALLLTQRQKPRFAIQQLPLNGAIDVAWLHAALSLWSCLTRLQKY